MGVEGMWLKDSAYANYPDYHCCYYSAAARGECWAVWKLGLQLGVLGSTYQFAPY